MEIDISALPNIIKTQIDSLATDQNYNALKAIKTYIEYVEADNQQDFIQKCEKGLTDINNGKGISKTMQELRAMVNESN